MTIAGLYPSIRGKEVLYPVFDWNFVSALLEHSEEVSNFHVFLPLDSYPPIRFPEVSNVSIHSVMELAGFSQENSVDVWHDFGYTDVSYLTHLRRLSPQHFPITMAVHPWSLASDPIKVFGDLTDSDALICSKPSMCEIIRSGSQKSDKRFLAPEVFTIPLGVDTTKTNISDKRDARYLLDLPEQTIIILCLTDFSVYEGGDLFPLIHAFQAVAEKHKEIRLILSGSDQYLYAQKIQGFINDSHFHKHIVLMPNTSESAESLLLSAADIFISPSDTIHRDNQIPMLKAMSNNLPVIATDNEKGIIEHGKNGLKLRQICKRSSYDTLNNYLPLVSEDVRPLVISQGIAVDTQQIIEFLTLLIENVTLRQTLGETARHYVEANHQWSEIVKRYIRLWHTLCEKVPSKTDYTIPSENQSFNRPPLLPGTNTKEMPFFSFVAEDIEDNTPLQLTASGEMLLKTQHLISYDAMKDIIYQPVVFEILNLARSEISTSEIINALLPLADQDDTDSLVPNITYHIMWSIKQGFISPSGEGQ